MVITACMLRFRRSLPALVLWQWVNQSFHAAVTYSNRNTSTAITTQQLGQVRVRVRVCVCACMCPVRAPFYFM
jgi:hypothetical protein